MIDLIYEEGICACGCGEEIIERYWHKYHPTKILFLLGHYCNLKNPMEEEEWRIKQKNGIGRGPDNHLWTGDFNWWAKELKKTYRECVLCKSPDKLEMHHKDKDQNNNERHNLIILCITCHHFWHDV